MISLGVQCELATRGKSRYAGTYLTMDSFFTIVDGSISVSSGSSGAAPPHAPVSKSVESARLRAMFRRSLEGARVGWCVQGQPGGAAGSSSGGPPTLPPRSWPLSHPRFRFVAHLGIKTHICREQVNAVEENYSAHVGSPTQEIKRCPRWITPECEAGSSAPRQIPAVKKLHSLHSFINFLRNYVSCEHRGARSLASGRSETKRSGSGPSKQWRGDIGTSPTPGAQQETAKLDCTDSSSVPGVCFCMHRRAHHTHFPILPSASSDNCGGATKSDSVGSVAANLRARSGCAVPAMTCSVGPSPPFAGRVGVREMACPGHEYVSN